MQSVRATGTTHGVADALGVDPQVVYYWIAGVTTPSLDEQQMLIVRLSRAGLLSQGFEAGLPASGW